MVIPSESDALEARWAPDPSGRNAQRYWDGSAWTDHVAPASGGTPVRDPLPPGQSWPAPGARPTLAGPPVSAAAPAASTAQEAATFGPPGAAGAAPSPSVTPPETWTSEPRPAAAEPPPSAAAAAVLVPAGASASLPATTPPTSPAPVPDTEPVDGPELPAGVTYTNPWLRLASYFLQGFLFTVTLGVGWLVWAAVIARRGQTPAKRLLNLQVIRRSTLRPVGFARMFFLRGLVGGIVCAVLFPLTLFVLVFMPFWDRHNQNLWDKVSGTYVVDDPARSYQAE